MRKRIVVTILFILTLLSVGCQTNKNLSNENNADISIYTSIYPIQYIVEQISDEDTAVTSVYPPGVDAHTYEPTSREMTVIADSDAFIYLGAGMEGFAQSAASALHSYDVLLIKLGDHPDLFRDPEQGDIDPHIWLDPLRMIDMAEIIKNELITLFPDNENMYEQNIKALKDKMIMLDEEFNQLLQSKNDKHIIVAHAAYGYWEERYDIKQIPISGLTSGSEPSQKELTHIVEFAKGKNIKHVIFEQNSSDRVSTIIKDHLDADSLFIHNLEVLTDEDIKNNEDYLSLMKKNLNTLDDATN